MLEIVKQSASRYEINPNINSDTKSSSANVKLKALKFVLSNKDNPGIKNLVKPGKLQDFAENEFAPIVLANTNINTPKNFFYEKSCTQIDFIKNNIKINEDNILFLKDLGKLLDDFTSIINEEKKNSGNLSFEDISQLAIKTLIDNEDIRNQEICKFKKIMIDEFQDNNSLNRDFLYLLSLPENSNIKIDNSKSLFSQIADKIVPDKLFFVGDEKQSIYAFRGADISTFNQLKNNSGNIKKIEMSSNYRSTETLINGFNEIFGNEKYGILKNNESKNNFDAYYSAKAIVPESTHKKSNKNNIEKPIVICSLTNLPNKKKNKEADDVSAAQNKTETIEPILDNGEHISYFIANKIKELKKETGKWSSFAILERSRGDRKSITKYLDMLNIPYEEDQYTSIFDDGIVNDFTNFLKLCVYPEDLNSLFSYLVSPLCGMSIENAEIIMTELLVDENGNLRSYNNEPVEENYKEYEKYNNGINFIKEYRHKVLSQPITTTISYLWNNLGYKYETYLNDNLNLKSELFDMFFELSRQADSQGKSISSFVEELEDLREKESGPLYYNIEKSSLGITDISYPLERTDAVQIMTIHKSKGLEFEYVFVYGCLEPGKNNNKPMLNYDKDFGVYTTLTDENNNKINTIETKSKNDNFIDEKKAAEFKRLLYVSITRAIKQVYIVGTNNKKISENNTEKIYQVINELINNDNPYKYIDFIKIPLITNEEIENLNLNNTNKQNLIDKISSAYEQEGFEHLCKTFDLKSPSKLNDDTQESLHFDINTQNDNELPGNKFGTFIHGFLENYVNDESNEDYIPDDYEFTLLPVDSQKKYSNQFKDIVENFAASQLGKELNETKVNNRFYKAEWAFTLFLENHELNEVCNNDNYTNENGYILNGSIDLIYENKDGTYTIVDYKSDKKEEPEHHLKQQRCYRKAASNLLGIDENKIYLKLYYVRTNHIIDLDDFENEKKIEDKPERVILTVNLSGVEKFKTWLEETNQETKTKRYLKADKTIYEKYHDLFPTGITSLFDFSDKQECINFMERIRNEPDFKKWNDYRDENGKSLTNGGEPSAFMTNFEKYLKKSL